MIVTVHGRPWASITLSGRRTERPQAAAGPGRTYFRGRGFGRGRQQRRESKTDAERAWLHGDALRDAAGRRSDAGRDAAFSGMVEVAQSTGWLDHTGVEVAAHAEWRSV
jgi:hypothetical protein